MNLLHSLLCFFLCYCGYLVCTSLNPVESVLFLILCFCNAAASLFLFHAEFLGLIFIIIYVGAIAVLFLFVIMMLNLKSQREDNNLLQMLFVVFVGFFAALSTILIGNIFKTNFFSESISQIDFNLLTDDLNNIDIFGQVLFNYYMSCFLLAGFILLIALVGSIVLTLRFNNTDEGQIVNKQLSRTDNFLSFFK
jgi:NADH-quinone oxidoreductase subunit J